ncbi:Predicted kinase, aminoglycoside phosphotransferase (APT) family [Jatrophihabitans endophyticus]|uniref:Predicted kinase, aminoglycoside phosphotransferase (APT) family n=1 Tax=Jatrophihabitans endophyticus TaxID=1206085 RepID=A0A1M5Q0A0_9ACTN|nr:phosphotransferase family protein [Jatrophihabitans endophyticus]SHH07201.1 Predicted kinase, aminoglycoside phosphotransferase (APT) family [Jatrophihabitans endophyticus]
MEAPTERVDAAATLDDDAQRWPELGPWLAGAGVEVAEPLTPTLIVGGRSNLTYRLDDAAGRRLVLRRPPLRDVLETAHDVGREYRIMAAVAAQGIPVPVMRALCPDPSVVGAPFYVMDFVDGTILASDADGAAWPATARGAASRCLVDVLARIHAVDVDAAGLGGLGRRENYIARQLARWQRQYSESSTRDIPTMSELYRTLVAAVPAQRFTALVHGDYRFGNVMIDEAGDVRAVLDWELAALGDPLADLGWLLATWREPGEPEGFESPTGQPGFLSRAEVVQRYEAVSGREVGDVSFYMCFALWRLACISEGVFARYRSGAMDGAASQGRVFGELVYDLSEAALHLMNAS